ncbi:hypothetical protein DPEC_G00205120 [Dallia pectoralis]|uniref:Uncharacterized protein n=1 Tax=Dallia pectoralis TaxID=75939 RepID=A0ACC2G4G8_DALPE|nr:hypothetical protein DPEC_G00205120 [Dallia pectoralis]
MATTMDEEERKLQRLKAALHHTVGRLCQSLGENQQMEFSRQVIAAISETTFRQCDVFAKDLEDFARHAKRSTVSMEDVKLVARRSTALYDFIQRKSEEIANTSQDQRDKKKSGIKRKNKDTEAME